MFSFPYRSPKLRVLDLREDSGCRIVCPEISTKSPACLFSCAHSEHSVLKRRAQHSSASSEHEVQAHNQDMEIIVNISLRRGNILRERGYLALLLNKVEQSSGSLHLCCRDLEIEKLGVYRNNLNRLDLKCLDNLSVFKGSLSEITCLLAQVVHLRRLCLSKVICSSLNGNVFQNFVSQLRFMDHLNELNFDSFDLRDHLEAVLR